MIKTVGSVCSGIEAASVAWEPLGYEFDWFSEIADFPSRVLEEKYSSIPNLGDMTDIPNMILEGSVKAPDLICGGTPCQAFSYAGFQNGLNDDRGNLTLKYVDIIEANDKVREKEDFTLNCKSHMNKGSYVDVPGNYVLDINYNKAKKIEIKEKLIDILNR